MENQRTQTKNTLRELAFVVGLLVFFIFCGVVFYFYVEDLRLVDAIYFTVMTLTTVGYGDFVPKTDIGKLFTSFYALLGIGTFLGIAGVLFHNAMIYSKEQAEKIVKNNKDE